MAGFVGVGAADFTTIDGITASVAVAALLVSIYGANLARGAQAWQRQRDDERRRSDLHIDVQQSAVHDVERDGWQITRVGPATDYAVTVRVTNRGEQPEYIRSIALDCLRNSEGGSVGQVLLDATEAVRLEPRQFVEHKLLVDFTLMPRSRPFTVIVETGSGCVTTAPKHWVPDLLDAVLGPGP